MNEALRQQPMAIADIRDNLRQSLAIDHTRETPTGEYNILYIMITRKISIKMSSRQ